MTIWDKSRGKSQNRLAKATQAAGEAQQREKKRLQSDVRPTPSRAAQLEMDKWPMATSNKESLFKALPIFDKVISDTDISNHYSPEQYSELLGRPDHIKILVLFTDIRGAAPFASGGLETSFDGVHYLSLGTVGITPIDFFSITNEVVVGGSSSLLRIFMKMDAGSARVRCWVTSLPHGRRRFAVVALDRILVGTEPYYSASEYNGMLGAVEKLTIIVLADQCDAPDGRLDLALEESPDGMEWALRDVLVNTNVPIVNGLCTEYNSASAPLSKFVRLRATLSGTDVSANVRLYVVGRGR